MSRLVLNNGAAPSTPAGNKVSIFSDSSGKVARQMDDTGKIITLSSITNVSTVAQSGGGLSSATRTYIAGSNLLVPSGKLQVGTHFRWKWNMTKTGAGTAASTVDIAVGTTGTTSDAARVSFTKPAGTAVIDEGYCEICAIVRSIGATGVMVGEFWMLHNLQNTGHMVIPTCAVNTVSSGFDMTVAGLIVGVCLTVGASDAITIQQMQSWAWNL